MDRALKKPADFERFRGAAGEDFDQRAGGRSEVF